jgi:hypothetical protein
MRPGILQPIAATSLLTLAIAISGCANQQYAAAPPPAPPPAYQQAPPLIAIADRDGFKTGRADGARDAYEGRPYRARSTRAYYDTPGFDPHLGGPFPDYQNAFRNAYLRGYDQGYHRG